MPPSRILDVSAGTRDRPSACSLMRMKELQDIIAPFGVHTEVESFDLKRKNGPNSVSGLVEAARPES